MLRLFPLLLIVVVIYNILVFGGGALGHADMGAWLAGNAVTFHMFSSANWSFTIGDFLILISLILLFVEVVKATRTTSNEIINHALSMLTFVIALVEFITLKGFATSPFFFIMCMTLFDVIAGYTISIVAAEHDLGLGRAGTD
ncbi:MAG TPA: hypothetical protein VH000_01505 [Rhizomicrobium sp.]|jgi:hypothetical protein|nr:hypothetical protein [Rhizomicrobium sp.]HEX4532879.1 hypothetical protein [Rhizomicrobium sp.]